MRVIIANSRQLPIAISDIDQAVQACGFCVSFLLSGHTGNVDLMAEV
jgi:hypothetical protein